MMEMIQRITDACSGGIIAIDGRCGSGKTTLAENLSCKTGAPVIHTDDFFLPKYMRTDERLSEAGGNFHRERFVEEVLIPLRNTGCCRYRPYDCTAGDFGGFKEVQDSRLYIVEGSYSCHPDLWNFYDLHVFLSVSSEEQMRRIIIREGEKKWEMFRRCWIPMEEMYFNKFSIAENCDICIK